MRTQPINLKWTMGKMINESVKRAIRLRLETILADELKRIESWEDTIRPKLNQSRAEMIERRNNKLISALKIVIYHLTPYFDRMDDEPTFVIKKKKE